MINELNSIRPARTSKTRYWRYIFYCEIRAWIISTCDGQVLSLAVLSLEHQAVFLAQPAHLWSPSDVIGHAPVEHTDGKCDIAVSRDDVLPTAVGQAAWCRQWRQHSCCHTFANPAIYFCIVFCNLLFSCLCISSYIYLSVSVHGLVCRFVCVYCMFLCMLYWALLPELKLTMTIMIIICYCKPSIVFDNTFC